jgi:hypothetical protein
MICIILYPAAEELGSGQTEPIMSKRGFEIMQPQIKEIN